MMNDVALRHHLARLLDWKDAHATFDDAVEGIPAEARGLQPANLPYSCWQLLEHIRRTQYDILDFCRNPDYQEREWPKEYWPDTMAPPDEGAWEASIDGFRRDRAALEQLAGDREVDLFSTIPHGTGQTYLRELVLVADHTAYHVGQMILLRRLLGLWPER